MSALNEMTIKDLIAQFNAIPGVEPLANWKGRKDLLVEKVAEAMKAARGTKTIREVSEAWLTAVDYTDDAGKPIGYTYEHILAQVLAEFPDANTTVKCLRWYNTKLNSDPNIKMPVRPRKKAVRPENLSVEQAQEPTGQETREDDAERALADPLA